MAKSMPKIPKKAKGSGAYSFASSTMPRNKTKKRMNPSAGPGEPDADDKKAMADTAQKPFPKKGIIKPSRKGLFTAKAKAAGMSTQAYAASVLANPKAHDPATVKQANFARNFSGAAKRGGSK